MHVIDGADGSPWDGGGWDMNHGFVIRAESEDEARGIAAQVFGDDNTGASQSSPWLDRHLTTCEPLDHDGEAGVVMNDYKRG
ncbi:hypothetical protein [Salinicola sp. CPA57]|uniref:hypothetical protein n=1 Tax=Salinicola sp. CPA57 TaxID=1949080 RepID=UPI0013008411|nr:hypothetical protein [Salinicola sp. CPA57]